jgi:hypothetical protein
MKLEEAHRIRNDILQFSDIYISENINEWIEETYKNYGVNIFNFCFCYEYVESYFDAPEKWLAGHKKKGPYYDQQSH